MERSQLYQFLPIIVMFSWMMVTPFIFPRDWMMRYALNMVGMVVCISFMVVTNEVLKWKAAEFTHIDCICRPSGDRLHFFVTDLETVEIEPGIFATALTLGEKVMHSFYGPIEKGGRIVLKHWGQWELRMGEYKKGKAVFKDQVVDHPKSAQVIVYEPQDVFDMDHLQPIPVYLLKDAPGDFHLSGDAEQIESQVGDDLLTKTVFIEGKKVTGAKLLFSYHNVKKMNEQLHTRNTELQRQGLHWHQVAVRLEEVNKQIKNELHSVLSSKSDMKQAVVEQVLTALEAHTKIRNALRELSPRNWLNMAAVTMILGIVVVGVFLTNPGDMMGWLANQRNQLFVILLAGVIGFVFFYARQQRKG